MRKIIFLLLILFSISGIARAQLSVLPVDKLPADYETWPGKTDELILKKDLVLKIETRVLMTNQQKQTGRLLTIAKINDDLVFVREIESYSKLDDKLSALITQRWLLSNGFVQLAGDFIWPPQSLIEASDKIWKEWDTFIKTRYGISDGEMKEVEKFFNL